MNIIKKFHSYLLSLKISGNCKMKNLNQNVYHIEWNCKSIFFVEKCYKFYIFGDLILIHIWVVVKVILIINDKNTKRMFIFLILILEFDNEFLIIWTKDFLPIISNAFFYRTAWRPCFWEPLYPEKKINRINSK